MSQTIKKVHVADSTAMDIASMFLPTEESSATVLSLSQGNKLIAEGGTASGKTATLKAIGQLTAAQSSLSGSSINGQHIADFANHLIEPLGLTETLYGSSELPGDFHCANPDAYIARKSENLVATLIELESRIREVHIVGEGADILGILDDVQQLQKNRTPSFGEFSGFDGWNSVLQFCKNGDGNSIATIVKLVEDFGEPYLRALITATCKGPEKAKITLCTAHNAKGLQFDNVRLSDDFPAPMEIDAFIEQSGENLLHQAALIPYKGGHVCLLKSELQLLYIAVTRARNNVTLPSWCYDIYADRVVTASLTTQPTSVVPSIAANGQQRNSRSEPLDMYAVLDFETTGQSPDRGDRAIEIGIVLMREGVEIDTYTSLINPGLCISSYITELTGISNEMLSAAPSAQEVMQTANEFVGNAQLVAHNAGVGKKFWRHEMQHSLGTDDKREFICTLMLSRRIFQSFVNHKLVKIASELAIDARHSHRALGDARVTAQVLSVMFERLRLAHPTQTIDGTFLHTYQRKTRSSLPNLTTEKQILLAANPPVVLRKELSLKKRKPTVNSAVKEKRAASMHAEAVSALQALQQLLDMKWTSDDCLDRGCFDSPGQFQPRLLRRPYIHYGEEGEPVDVEYLSMTSPEPEGPVLPVKPDRGLFDPDIGMLDKLRFREQRLVKEAQNAYFAALQQWDANRQRAMAKFIQDSNRWTEAAKAMDLENTKRYEQCVEDQEEWTRQKQVFDEQHQASRESSERFRHAYDQKEPHAVQQYVSRVLSRSSYPDYFPRNAIVDYDYHARAIDVRLCLIHPDDLPNIASVSYVKASDEIKRKPLSKSAGNTLYGNVVRAMCIRTLHEVLASDKVNAVQHVIVTGYVNSVDLSTGHDQDIVIASVATDKSQFQNLRLERVNATCCFEGLGGRGTSRGLPRLRAVEPFRVSDIVDVWG